jgi:hypothetical protein
MLYSFSEHCGISLHSTAIYAQLRPYNSALRARLLGSVRCSLPQFPFKDGKSDSFSFAQEGSLSRGYVELLDPTEALVLISNSFGKPCKAR